MPSRRINAPTSPAVLYQSAFSRIRQFWAGERLRRQACAMSSVSALGLWSPGSPIRAHLRPSWRSLGHARIGYALACRHRCLGLLVECCTYLVAL